MDLKEFLFLFGGIGVVGSLLIAVAVSPWSLIGVPLGGMLIVLAFKL